MKKLLLPVLFILTLFPFTKVHAQYTAGPVDVMGLTSESGPQAGMVTLKWSQASADTVNYHIGYGLEPNKDLYGAMNVGRANAEFGNQNRYTIKALTPGTTYYFRVFSLRGDGTVRYTSQYVMSVAASGETANTFFTGPIGRSQLIATPGPMSGQVTLTWQNFWGDATNYHIVYGLAPGAMKWGALNVGKQPVNSYTVGMLTPGVTYYFSIVPVRGGVASYTSISVAGRAL